MDLKSHIGSQIIKIIERLQAAGYETYLVGGAVRDLMLKRTPKDYDLSTSATPEEIRSLFGRRYARIIGRRFKLVHVYNGAEIIEVTTFRRPPVVDKEGSVLPFDNEFGTAEEDAWRRDFTVNSIFYDPVADKIVDHTGVGMKDLKKKIVRTVGDPRERFEEDPVRMLRALKLVGQYGFTLEKNTEEALRATLPFITRCSASRLTLELEKIIKRPYSEDILRAFYDYGFLAYYLPFLNEHWNTEECAYMLELLHERNNRLIRGEYRDSISLAIATAALPFIEKKIIAECENVEERGWTYYAGIEKDIHRIIRGVFAPYNFPKRIIASSVGAVMLQPALLNKNRKNRTLENRRYRHARELMTLQNNIRWQDESLFEFWPKHGKRGGKQMKRKRRPPARKL